MPLRTPPGMDPELRASFEVLNAELGRHEPRLVGSRFDGSDIQFRFVAPIWVTHVQVHIQSDAVGEGGLAAYDPDNYTSTEEVDCRGNRLQDYSFTPSGGVRYVVFLIPVTYDGAETKVLFDGVSAADFAAFTDFGY